jgi:hypothetical protein
MKTQKKRSLKQQLALLAVAIILGAVGLKIAGWNPFAYVNIPVKGSNQKVYSSQAEAIFAGDLTAQKSLANQAIAAVQQNIDPAVFKTGSDRYNAEWTIATYQMTALGLSQMAIAHPELKAEYSSIIEKCLDNLLRPETIAFATEVWGENGLLEFSSNKGHAYLGYTNLALSMYRRANPKNRFARINDRLTEAFSRRLEQAPHGTIETYPNETYPPDVAAAIGSIGLYDRATGADHRKVLAKSLQAFRNRLIDPKSGMLHQATDSRTGTIQDKGRASGTTISVYFLSFADPKLSGKLFQAIATTQRSNVAGFTGIREYPPGQDGLGDVDSGPLIMGLSPTASVFALSGARLTGNLDLFQALYRSLDVFGSFSDNKNSIASQIGGPLGKALLLAMVTAPSHEGEQ